jgi:hypothetical protein
MTSIRTLSIAGIALGLPLFAATVSHAGPGSLPNHLIRRPEAKQADKAPAYALTGDARPDHEWRVRQQAVGGARDARTVFER